jgi:exopolysaccharide biosynthesis polyprenyl glycosylphosphotransferase
LAEEVAMATSDFWQRVSAAVTTSSEFVGRGDKRDSREAVKVWMFLDALTVFIAVAISVIYRLHVGPWVGLKWFLHGTLIPGRSTKVLLSLVLGYTISLLTTSKRLRLYTPMRLTGILHEQQLNIQACFIAGLLLAGTLYALGMGNMPRGIATMTTALVWLGLSVRRLMYRLWLYRCFDKGIGTRNVLIVGDGPEGNALRHHLESIRHLGFTFKGFVDLPGCGPRFSSSSGDVAGALDMLFQQARKLFVDEIFFTTPCNQGVVLQALTQARTYGVDLRVVPDLYDGVAWNSAIEYVGQFPTIPLYCGHVPTVALIFKRILDLVFSSLVLITFSPLLLVIAAAIKWTSPGTIFYVSERIGKKGHVFKCLKFRTMVNNAEQRRDEIAHLNERDGVLFKVKNDPRITWLGRFLRKYSLDELPQFFNVLHGDMSVVGPRPPIASEVEQYQLNQLRRLDVTPGITGLWQVQGRKDPSFDSYVSLDVSYIENWSLWLDIKIIVKTIAVVIEGTGS